MSHLSRLSGLWIGANAKQRPRQPEAPKAGKLRGLRLTGMPQATKARGLRRQATCRLLVSDWLLTLCATLTQITCQDIIFLPSTFLPSQLAISLSSLHLHLPELSLSLHSSSSSHSLIYPVIRITTSTIAAI